MSKTIISVSGPSTSGKTVLISDLKNKYGFGTIITSTTRQKREGEIHGVHYYFYDDATFNQMIKNKEFIEHVHTSNCQYGMSKEGLQDSLSKSDTIIVALDPQGAQSLKEYSNQKGYNFISVFVNNPLPILIDRLKLRYQEDGNANIEVYKDRLFSMVFTEQEQWVKPAISNSIYDIFIPEYNSDNKEQISQTVYENIKSMFDVKKTTRNKLK